MRIRGIALAAGLLTAPAMAFEASDALPCFNYLPMDMGIGAEAEINVMLDQYGIPTSIDVQRYQPDLEAAFAQRFGEVWGVQLARALRRGLEALRGGSAALLRDGAEYLSEEARDLVPKAELEAHLDEVDGVRDAVDRLEARIARVRRRIGGGGGEGT